MGSGLIGDGVDYDDPASGCIVIGANITNGLFRWRSPVGAPDQNSGGGGIVGVTIHDASNDGVGRTYEVDSVVNVEATFAEFNIDRCTIDKIKRTAVRVGRCNLVRITNSQMASNGDTGKATIDIPNLSTPLAGAFISECVFHDAVTAPYIVVGSGRGLWLRDSYFESNDTNHPTIIDASAGGGIQVDNCTMSSHGGSAILMGASRSAVRNTYIENDTSSPVIQINAQNCFVENCLIVGGTGSAIAFGDNCGYGRISNCWLYLSGNIDASNVSYEQINNVFMMQCASTESHQIKVGFGGTVVGCLINGNLLSGVSGIQSNGSVISGNVVINLEDDADGIESMSYWDTITGNIVAVDEGKDLIYVNGTKASNNLSFKEGWGTASVVSGAVTLDAERGTITTESASTAPGATYTFTLTNSICSGIRSPSVTFDNDTNTGGAPLLRRATPANGSCVFEIYNAGSSSFNGKLKVNFVWNN
jgi:hypothetical protein